MWFNEQLNMQFNLPGVPQSAQYLFLGSWSCSSSTFLFRSPILFLPNYPGEMNMLGYSKYLISRLITADIRLFLNASKYFSYLQRQN